MPFERNLLAFLQLEAQNFPFIMLTLPFKTELEVEYSVLG